MEKSFKKFVHEERTAWLSAWNMCLAGTIQQRGETAPRTKSLVRLKEVRSSSLAETVASFFIY